MQLNCRLRILVRSYICRDIYWRVVIRVGDMYEGEKLSVLLQCLVIHLSKPCAQGPTREILQYGLPAGHSPSTCKYTRGL
jgi:hypothetical protein